MILRLAHICRKAGARTFLSASLLLLIALTACTSTQRHRGGTATVEFIHPEKFTDIELRNSTPERTRDVLLPDLANYIRKEAKLHIPEGEHLLMQITNIDDAGWIRPIGATPRRTVRQSQPARVDFNYTLTDASGTTVASGGETLSDLTGNRMDRSFDTEQMPLVKSMLGDWITQLGLQRARQGATGGTR